MASTEPPAGARRIAHLLDLQRAVFRDMGHDRAGDARRQALDVLGSALGELRRAGAFQRLPANNLALTVRERLSHVGHTLRHLGHLATLGPVLVRDDGTLWVVRHHAPAGSALSRLDLDRLSSDQLDTLGREVRHAMGTAHEPAATPGGRGR